MAADKSRREGKEVVPTAVLDPPQAGGVKLEPETGKPRSKRNIGIVAGRVTDRASVGRSASIPTNLDPDPEKLKTRKSSMLALHQRVGRTQNWKRASLCGEAHG